MTELTKKVIEAGLVPSQSIRLLKMWRCLPESLPEGEAEEKTQEELIHFVQQIEALLDEERGMTEMRETDLDLFHLLKTDPHFVTVVIDNEPVEMTVGKTRTGQLAFPVGDDGRVQELVCRRGNTLVRMGVSYRITHVEPRYVGKELRFYLCDVVSGEL
jgi:hypothetical protein